MASDLKPVSPFESNLTQIRANRLAAAGYVGIALFGFWYWFNSPWEDPILNLATIGIVALGLIPMLLWLKRGDASYPLMEIMLLVMIPFYAAPLINEHETVATYPDSVLLSSALVVLIFQICCLFGGLVSVKTFTRSRHRSWLADEIFPEDSLKFTAYSLTLNTLWLGFSTFTTIIPSDWVGVFRAIFFGIGMISLFIQARFWGSGKLRLGAKIFLVINMIAQLLIIFVALMLIIGITMILIGLVGYFSTARRIPWSICIPLAIILTILHNGKSKMRQLYWGEQAVQVVTIDNLPDFYTEWITYGLDVNGEKEHKKSTSAMGLLDRASLFQMVCYAVDTVPSRSPYLNGETYWLVPPQIFPRFLWPNKPSPNDAVKILSVRMGYLSAEQAETTSIGYGLLVEAYANFGFPCVAIVGFLLGFSLSRIAISTMECATLSIPGIFRILCLAWCLTPESPMAVWLSSLYQACIAIFGPLLAWRSISK